MNKFERVKIIVCLIGLAVLPLCFTGAAQAAGKEGTEVGRSNPFAKIEISKKAAPRIVLNPAQQVDEEMPELFLEIVTVKFCDAKNLKTAFDKMISGSGSISVDEKTNSLFICDTKDNLDKIIAQVKKLEETEPLLPPAAPEKEQKPELFVESITLKFLNAKNIKPVADKMSSEYGSISIDEKTNSLIICDAKKKVGEILNEISKADKTPPQIMIEVVILDVQLNDEAEIGINWDLLSTKDYDISYRQNFTTSRIGSTIESATTIGNTTAFNSTGLGGNFAVISGTIRNVVHLIQQKRDVEILASPRVMAVSGQSAFIEAIEEVPYQELSDTAQGGAQALTYTQYKNVGIKLNVSATQIDSNDVFLTVEAEQNVQTGESTAGAPIVDTRRARTSLLLRDGQVVVFGGLRRQEKTTEVDQIPILGDLPIIGALFRSTNKVVKNSELIVFLSPHIYTQSSPQPIPEEAMEKFDEITRKQILSLLDE